MPAAECCSIVSCDRAAVASCFECDRICCERHLTSLSLVAAARPVRVRVCPDCLHRYQADPEIQALLTFEVARTC